MTAIAGITTTESPWQEHKPPPQAKLSSDFAQELARQHAPSHDGTKASAGDEKAESYEEMAPGDPKSDAPMEPPQEVMADQDPATPVDLLYAAMQQDGATTQPVGVTEALLGARVFGWHALAQSYLSELAAFDAVPTEGVLSTRAQASSIPLEPQAEVAADAEATGIAETPAMTEVPEALPVAEPISGIEGAGDPVDGMEANAPCLAAMASADCWAERSLRFKRQPDGQGVAWLRDYRLDAAAAGQVVRLVLQEARAKGFALDRIMLNGREAWSSRGRI